jgi:hypothetical protein
VGVLAVFVRAAERENECILRNQWRGEDGGVGSSFQYVRRLSYISA